VLCASTGNTAASAAAYAARAGLDAVVLLPRGGVAAGKLLQAFAHGARVVALDGGFDQALDLARVLASRYPAALVNSVNPDRIAGQQTAAYEIVEQLGRVPEVLALPVGNGGNITACWAGFRRAADRRRASRPRIIGAQAEGAAPLVRGAPVADPQTAATAIRIGRPASWDTAAEAARESGGTFLAVSDTAIEDAQREIARQTGIFCELASAASVAGLRAAVAARLVRPEESVVCILTGHGLKDPEAARRLRGDVMECPAVADEIAQRLGW
jgi:threonine synthase